MPSTTVEKIKASREKGASEITIDFLRHEDLDHDHLQQLSAVLTTYNTRSITLQKIRVLFCLSTENGSDDNPGRIPLNMWNFIQGLADIRTVTSLELEGGLDASCVYVHPLTVFLRKIGDRLESLKMDDFRLIGTTQEILDFKAAIGGLSALKSFEFYNEFMIFVDETHNLNHDLDTTLAATLHGVDGLMPIISHLPSLEHFTIKSDMWEAQEGNTPIEPISHLLANQNIMELELGNFSLSSQGYKILPIVGRALQKNVTLHRLKLDILMLQHDHVVDYTNLHGIAETSLIWEPLARALEVHPSLQELEMTSSGSYCPRFDPFLLLAADAISRNSSTSLQKLRIKSLFSYSESVEKAFLKLLISNYSLRQVSFLTGMYALDNEYETHSPNSVSLRTTLQSATETRAKIDFFLRLNRRGRKDIMARLEDASPTEWTDILAWANNEASEAYYYLRMNPSLCNLLQLNRSAAPVGTSRRNRITHRHTQCLANENSGYRERLTNVTHGIPRPTLVRPVHITTPDHILASKQRCDSMIVININESVGFDQSLIETIKKLQVTWDLETVVLIMWSSSGDNSFLGSLLGALSELDRYRHLHITNWGSEIILDDLSMLLESRVRHRLERFVYTGTTFVINNRVSKQRFVRALNGLKSLKDFTFEDPTHPEIDGIDKAIAGLPCVRQVDLTNKTSLRHFFVSPSITSLSVGWCVGSDEKLRLDQISLEQNQTMSRLKLKSDWNYDCLISIAKALESNTCLEELDITGSPFGMRHKLDHSLIMLADSLRRNDETALRKLAVFGGYFTEGSADVARYRDNLVAEAFLKSLSTNCTLEDLKLYCLRDNSCLDSWIRNSIALLMRLNKDGQRKFLMSNRYHLTKETWIHALDRFDEDTDILFYYLRHNPWLCPGGSKQVNRDRIEVIAVIRGVDELWG